MLGLGEPEYDSGCIVGWAEWIRPAKMVEDLHPYSQNLLSSFLSSDVYRTKIGGLEGGMSRWVD